MKRSIITTDGNGNIIMPTDIGATAMSEWELCALFGVTAPTFRAGLPQIFQVSRIGQFIYIHNPISRIFIQHMPYQMGTDKTGPSCY